mmetsp:Transcript_40021/g.103610  ORF Transcript_40021/g.103610 Transcript_40021/m.103610 type:complete len:268 (+) Transcript_40021:668-1471(+)
MERFCWSKFSAIGKHCLLSAAHAPSCRKPRVASAQRVFPRSCGPYLSVLRSTSSQNLVRKDSSFQWIVPNAHTTIVMSRVSNSSSFLRVTSAQKRHQLHWRSVQPIFASAQAETDRQRASKESMCSTAVSSSLSIVSSSFLMSSVAKAHRQFVSSMLLQMEAYLRTKAVSCCHSGVCCTALDSSLSVAGRRARHLAMRCSSVHTLSTCSWSPCSRTMRSNSSGLDALRRTSLFAPFVTSAASSASSMTPGPGVWPPPPVTPLATGAP